MRSLFRYVYGLNKQSSRYFCQDTLQHHNRSVREAPCFITTPIFYVNAGLLSSFP